MNRAYSSYSRSKLWHEKTSNGFIVELVESNLKELQALELEASLISKLKGLINHGVQQRLDFEDLNTYFKIDRESPSGLSRIKGVWNGSYYVGNIGHCGHIRKEKGIVLGWKIRHLGKTLHIHRAVWELVNGKIPDNFVIDHIDGDPLNNKIENLRCVTTLTNSRNKKKSNRGSTEVTGVRFKANGYEAQVSFNDSVRYKRFGVRKYGKEEAFRLACEWRAEQVRLLNEQGAGYTERHGT